MRLSRKEIEVSEAPTTTTLELTVICGGEEGGGRGGGEGGGREHHIKSLCRKASSLTFGSRVSFLLVW